MGSVAQSDGTPGKAGQPESHPAARHGRHRARSRRRRALKAAAVLLPVAAAAGFGAYQAQASAAPPADPVAGSVASYYLRPPQGATAGRGLTASHAPLAASSASPSASSPAASKPSPAASATTPPPPAKPSCAGNGAGGTGMLPYNYITITDFLLDHGYTPDAAAGIAGNIWQESKGDPEAVGSGGGGLIGFTPLPSGFVTGDAAADLQTQLAAVLKYNAGWSQYIPVVDKATSATQAAYDYMAYFERPGIPAASNREDAAAAVAQACGFTS